MPEEGKDTMAKTREEFRETLEGFLLFKENEEVIKAFKDESIGKALKAVYGYFNRGEIPEGLKADPMAWAAFILLKTDVDRYVKFRLDSKEGHSKGGQKARENDKKKSQVSSSNLKSLEDTSTSNPFQSNPKDEHIGSSLGVNNIASAVFDPLGTDRRHQRGRQRYLEQEAKIEEMFKNVKEPSRN